MDTMKIEIITTMNEDLKETGFGTIKACDSVFNSINKINHSVELNICQTIEDLNAVVKRKPDLVILAVKYIITENKKTIWLSEFFAKNEINFSGSSKGTLMFDSNKVLAKSYLKNHGISTARYFTAIPEEYKRDHDLPMGYPLFLKPSDAANGNGIDDLSFVNNFAEFESKVLSLYNFYKLPILVEEYIDGKEFTVAILKTKGGDLLVSAIEIVPPESNNGLRILGSKVKMGDTEKLKKIENNIMKDRVKKLAIDVYIDLGARDYARIDIKSNKNGQCFFMEVNLVPGMTSGSSYFPKAFEIDLGLSYEEVVETIVDEGTSRVPLNNSTIKEVDISAITSTYTDVLAPAI